MVSPLAPFVVTIFIHLLAYLRLTTQSSSLSAVLQAPDPRTWRKPEMTTSVKDRLGLVRGAMDEALQPEQFNQIGQFRDNPAGANWAFAGQLYGQMAEVDHATRRTQYCELMATTYFPQAEKFAGRVDFESQYVRSHPPLAYTVI
ncbi:hypothetical protein B0H16DRAFT_106367 [Mycena metata]|uniref:Uncharacterized protein n=1 Tax=Mycena metata TaxID=1033252 RepID=A0AAD7MY98_9AGAR|nr:hypothetical protein B0H16DRAFT_106367 [Mycena metata]